jgi:hypothetical protein
VIPAEVAGKPSGSKIPKTTRKTCNGPPSADVDAAEAKQSDRRGQRRVIAAHDGLYFGADMDAALNSASDRYDG